MCLCKLCFYKSFKVSSTRGQWFNHALLESKIRGTMSFAQWWVLDLISKSLGIGWSLLWGREMQGGSESGSHARAAARLSGPGSHKVMGPQAIRNGPMQRSERSERGALAHPDKGHSRHAKRRATHHTGQ